VKKLIANKIIIYITIFILALLFFEEIVEIKSALSLFKTSPSLIMISLGFALVFIIPLLTGFLLAVPFILFVKKESLNKTLRDISYVTLFLLVLLFIYHLFEKYTNIFKDFYGFINLAEFMYFFRYDKGPLLWTAIIQFCIETITFFLFATKSWISFIAGFILHICLEIRKIKK